jgi:hypothetical protein
MISKAAGRLRSHADAAFALELAGVNVSGRHVQRIANAIGAERARRRDEKVVLRRRRELPVRVAAIPDAVAAEVDGGRARTREVGQGPGVHQQQNKEDKIACLVTLQSQEHQADPQPQPPESFLEPRRVRRLARQMQGQAGGRPQEEELQEDASAAGRDEGAERPGRCSPVKRVRTCVASMATSREFGPMMAAEAQERGFYQARKRAFLGDGAAYNWTIHRGHFPDFEAITDFLHVLCYVYLAAWAAGADEAERWSIYVGWMRACWQGRVREVIERPRAEQVRIGEPPEGEELDAKDPRRLVAEASSYRSNNEARMDYPR